MMKNHLYRNSKSAEVLTDMFRENIAPCRIISRNIQQLREYLKQIKNANFSQDLTHCLYLQLKKLFVDRTHKTVYNTNEDLDKKVRGHVQCLITGIIRDHVRELKNKVSKKMKWYEKDTWD